MKAFQIAIILVSQACNSSKHIDTVVLLSCMQTTTERIQPRRDGLYSLVDTTWLINRQKRAFEVDSINNPLIFINRAKVRWANYLISYDYTELKLDYYKALENGFEERIGEYCMSSDTILAKIPIILYRPGRRQKMYAAFFRGVL